MSVLLTMSCAPQQEGKTVEQLLLSAEEFAKFPNVLLSDADDEALLVKKSGDVPPQSAEENARNLAELAEGYDPAPCWVLNVDGRDSWRVGDAFPVEYASVVARSANPGRILERVFRYEPGGGGAGVVERVAATLRACPSFTANGPMGTYPVSVVDRTGEFDHANTVVFSNEHDEWYALSAAGDYLMTFYVEEGSTTDPIGLITRALAVFREGTA